MVKKRKIIITCEHASNNIPKKYLGLFKGHSSVLETHRAIDFGALEVANLLGKKLKTKVFCGTVSRLIIDLNRSLTNKSLFSEFMNRLAASEKSAIIQKYYNPYKTAIEKAIVSEINKGNQVIHLSIHSFTPELNNKKRNCTIGLLYDPSSKQEKKYCLELKDCIINLNSSLRVRFNYPYKGIADSLVTNLRRNFKSNVYCGLEIEINQKEYFKNGQSWKDLKALIVKSIVNIEQ